MASRLGAILTAGALLAAAGALLALTGAPLAVAGAPLGRAATRVTPLGRAATRARHRTTPAPCLNAARRGLRDIHPAIARVPEGAPGKLLPGRRLVSQEPWAPGYVDPDPLLAHYPHGKLPQGPLSWRNIFGVAPSKLLYAAKADAVFNGDHARYRIAFNESYFGVTPTNAGDFNGDGVDDLLIPDHYAYVDGQEQAGQVELYYGRRGHHIDPTRDLPDVIFYGDEGARGEHDGGKLGIALAPAGDVNGDGRSDLVIAAAFHSVPLPHHRRVWLAGRVYLVYGGYLGKYRCPVKIRASDIGTKLPGIVFYGGRDGGLYTGWANELDAGRFSGHGQSDIIIGSYDPYTNRAPFNARAYLIYGSRHLPLRYVGYRLGLDTNRRGIRSTVYSLPDASITRSSLGFSASFVGDLTGNGHNDLAFTAAGAGPNAGGEAYVFFDPPARGIKQVPIQSAPLTIFADQLDSPSLQFSGIDSVRPNGDVYGDGRHDVLITARYTRGTGGSYVGAVGVLRGRPTFPSRLGFSQLDTILYGTQPGSVGQPSMAHAADFDGDGCTDIVVNDATYEENIGGSTQYRGRLWLVRGRASLPHTVPLEQDADRTFLADNRFPGYFGFNWDTGDWNHDGRPDLVIADHYSGDRKRHEFAGRDYLFYNRSLKLPWHPAGGCRAR